MANNTTNNPWIIDTASATPITTDMLSIDKFRWVGATTAGHELSVTDKNGKVLLSSFASGANFETESSSAGGMKHEIRANGLIVPTLASGKLYVHLH